jgi:hypothetical protein
MNGCLAEVESSEEDMNHPRKIGWSQSGSLTPGSTQGAVNLQAQFPVIGPYTVQLNIEDPNGPLTVNNEIIRAQADIQWSVEGNTVSRTVDCTKGITVSGVAEAVTVKIRDRSIVTLTNKVPYVVSINVAPGTRPSVQQPPVFTGDRQRLNGGLANGNVPVPAGAISAQINVSGILIGQPVVDPDDYIVRQTANGGTNLKSYSPFRYDGWIPLAAGCTSLNFEQAAVVVGDWYWFTSFGIDG